MTHKRALIFISCFIGLCITTAVVVSVLRPPVFTSHNDVIVYMLQRQGITVERVSATLPWPEGVNYYAYGPAVYPYHLNVDLQLRDGRQAKGIVECKRDRYDCLLTIATLNLDRTAMPNIQEGSSYQLPAWLNKLARQLGFDL